MMHRRTVLYALLGSAMAVFAAPLDVEAQQAGVRRIGIIANTPRIPVTDSFWDAFVAGLQEYGWTESGNIVIERRYVEPREEAALAAAEELIRIRVEVIVVAATQTALAAKQASRTVPIVVTVPADLVAVGLVAAIRTSTVSSRSKRVSWTGRGARRFSIASSSSSTTRRCTCRSGSSRSFRDTGRAWRSPGSGSSPTIRGRPRTRT